QIEVQLAQEVFLRTTAEWKSKGIEEALRQRPEVGGENPESGVHTTDAEERPVERFLSDALSLIAGTTAQLGAARTARLAAERLGAGDEARHGELADAADLAEAWVRQSDERRPIQVEADVLTDIIAPPREEGSQIWAEELEAQLGEMRAEANDADRHGAQ